MFFKKKTQSKDIYKNEIKNDDDLEKEIPDESLTNSDFLEGLDGDLELDFEEDNIFDEKVTPKQRYSTILKLFFDDYSELSSSRDRLSAMIDVGIFDDESFDIIDDTKWQAEHTLRMYNNLMEGHTEEFKMLDAQCKNIDFRIRKSLELEINALSKLESGITNGDQKLAQSGIDENEKALNIISPIFEDMQDIILNAFYE